MTSKKRKSHWNVLYRSLSKLSRSLIPPDRNGSSKSFIKSFDSVFVAENYVSYKWISYSRKKRAAKDRVKRLRFELDYRKGRLEKDYTFENYTKSEIEEFMDSHCTAEIDALTTAEDYFDDIHLYMEALSKVLSRIKHFREDLGRQLKLIAMEKGSDG